MRRLLVWTLVLAFTFSGCAGVKTRTHRFLEHIGIDWFNF